MANPRIADAIWMEDGPGLAYHQSEQAPVNCAVTPAELAQDSFERRVFDLTNEFRRQNGLNELRWDSSASRAAAWKARELPAQTQRTGFLDHNDDQPPRSFSQRMQDCGVTGFPSVGENIALGYTSPEAVIEGWKGSSGHRQNMLRSWRSMGVGYATGNSWVQVFSGAEGDNNTGGGTDDPEPPPPNKCRIEVEWVVWDGSRGWVPQTPQPLTADSATFNGYRFVLIDAQGQRRPGKWLLTQQGVCQVFWEQ